MLTVRPANRDDLQAIALCIEPFVKEGKVLPRTLDEPRLDSQLRCR